MLLVDKHGGIIGLLLYYSCLQVKESGKLRQIMQTILTLGNALNQGTTRGIFLLTLIIWDGFVVSISPHHHWQNGKVSAMLFRLNPFMLLIAGSAVGFKLDSLLKLSDTRARNNKMTLMHYLCKVDMSKSSNYI